VINQVGSRSFYTVFEHTADVGIEVTASSMEELFVHSALALADIMFERSPSGTSEGRLIMVVGSNPEELLIAWLNELLYIYAVERLVFSDFTDTELTETTFMTRARGERADPERHGLEMEIKAATYHGFSIERDGDTFRARIIFDI
jgi:SHS2 domain-containing protein